MIEKVKQGERERSEWTKKQTMKAAAKSCRILDPKSSVRLSEDAEGFNHQQKNDSDIMPKQVVVQEYDGLLLCRLQQVFVISCKLPRGEPICK